MEVTDFMCDSHNAKADMARIHKRPAPCLLEMIITARYYAMCLHMFLRQPWSDRYPHMAWCGAAKSGTGPCKCYQVPALASNTLTAVIFAYYNMIKA